MALRVSFSQISRWLKCGKNYEYYYVDRLREKTQSAFLVFGSALDNSLNALLYNLKNEGKVTIDYKKIFDDNWQTVTINEKTYHLADCTLIGYAKADFVEELLKEDDVSLIKKSVETMIPSKKNLSISELQIALENKRSARAHIEFTESENKVLNIMNWLSMRRKAHLMLDSYVEQVIPQIEEVKFVQKKIELKSETDDLIGYTDAVVRFKGKTEFTALDNKSASRPYAETKVKFSEQLSLYCYSLSLKSAAYAVMCKQIKLNKIKTCTKCSFISESSHKTCNNMVNEKRCAGEWDEKVKPEATVQLLIDEIPERTQELVIDNISNVTHAITAGIFVRNFEACSNWYGSPCQYFSLCYNGKDDSLEKLPQRDNVR